MTEPKKPAKGDGDTPLLEWISGGIGALLFLAAIVLLAGEGMKPPAPPEISGRVVSVEQQESRWLVTIEVGNAGDAASGVRIEVVSGSETRDLTVDFLPTQAIASGGVYFDEQPVSGSIRVAVTGYLAP